MITMLAGQIIGSATFTDLAGCLKARELVENQSVSKLEVVCTYQKKKVDNSRQIIKLFSGALDSMSKLPTESE